MSCQSSDFLQSSDTFPERDFEDYDVSAPDKSFSGNTQRSSKTMVKIFRDFLKDKKHPPEFENYTKEELSIQLKEFYVFGRTHDGKPYTNNSLISIRSGLSRYLKSRGAAFDIVYNPEFADANKHFKAQTKRNRESGRGRTTLPPVAKEDLVKLYRHKSVFDTDNPTGLQRKVWFEITYYLCRKGGRDIFRQLTPSDFRVEEDSHGRFVYKVPRDGSAAPRMYSTGGAICPVASFEKYVSLLNPECPFFFQQPKIKETSLDHFWYKGIPTGGKSIGRFMNDISKIGHLSQVYGNKSVQATPAEWLQQSVYDTQLVSASAASYRGQISHSHQAIGSIQVMSGLSSSIQAMPGLSSSNFLSDSALPYFEIKPEQEMQAPLNESS